MKTIGQILIILLVIGVISGGFYLMNYQSAAASGQSTEGGAFVEGDRPAPPSGEGFQPRGEMVGSERGGGGAMDIGVNILKISVVILVIAGGTWGVEKLRSRKPAAAK